MSKYDVIYLDPPWSYDDKAHAGERGSGYKYTTMTMRDLAGLPISVLAKPDCAMFLWATMPLLPEALGLMSEWGFDFKTVAFVWVKISKTGKLVWGMGNWTRANAELVLMGIRGRPKRASAGVHQVVLTDGLEPEVVVSERLAPHSRKPQEVRDRISQLMGPEAQKIELFATEVIPGWTCSGLGADGVDIRDLLGVEHGA